MRGLLGAFVAGAALLTPVATAEPHDCASVDRTAALLRTAAVDTSDPAVRDRALEAAAAAERYANVLAAATSVDGVLEPPGEEMSRAVNTMAALERVCPAPGG